MGNSQSATPADQPQSNSVTETATDDIESASTSTNAKRTASEATASPRVEEDTKDPQHYLSRDNLQNTTELFKVELRGMHRRVDVPEIKRLLKKLKLAFKKVKKGTGVAYINFTDEASQQAAITALNDYEYRGHTLRAQAGRPKDDPYVKSRDKRERQDREPKRAKHEDQSSDKSPEEEIALRTAPYYKMPYEEQLAKKQEELVALLRKCTQSMTGRKGGSIEYAITNAAKYDGLPCPLLPMVRSPVLNEYRNKCEFTIGVGVEGKATTVGFQLGQYSAGTLSVAEPSLVPHVSASFKTLAKELQTFLREKSQLKPYNRLNHEGHYRQVTIRANTDGEMMMMLQVSDKALTRDILETERDLITQFVSDFNAQHGLRLEHVFVQIDNSASGMTDTDRQLHTIMGQPAMIDTLLGKKFRVSPEAFFQVNIPAAEVLYSLVGKWCNFDAASASNTCLLDICCGTGTIGQIYAHQVKRVLGFDICAEAIEDAKENAKMNGVTNCSYFAGKAEKTMAKVVEGVHDDRVVGIVDPPRAGLHSNVIKAIRKCAQLETLVYVACNFKASSMNIVDLCRPPSKKYPGEPFQAVQVQAVDLFPQTPHMEVVLLLLRGQALKTHLSTAANEDEVKAATHDGVYKVVLDSDDDSEMQTQ